MQSKDNAATSRIKDIVTLDPQSRFATVVGPFRQFTEAEEAGGIALIVCTAIALILANSPLSEGYFAFWETHLTLSVGPFNLDNSLLHWVNDALMVIFFFYVGLEIKRELLIGELSSPKNAALPIAAALGGMIVPAAIYVAFNAGGPGAHGWGVPMATDIAFALGILALLGKRVPFGLTVFLAALAIADDLGAVVVIAVFYSGDISMISLGVAGAFLLLLAGANWAGARSIKVYAPLGIVVWLAVLQSGVHATIAGVLIAATIPARTAINSIQFLDRGRRLLDEFESMGVSDADILGVDEQEAVVAALEKSCEQAQAPLQRLMDGLAVWVAFLIMPIFALANAGIRFEGSLAAAFSNPVTLGVALGLFFGKQIGITLFAWLSVKLRFAALPSGVTWRHIYGAAVLGGIGFTMSMFIASLGFTDQTLLIDSKIGIITGSLVSAVVGYLLLRKAAPVHS